MKALDREILPNSQDSDDARVEHFLQDRFGVVVSEPRRLKCFIAGSHRRPLPTIDDVEYIFDADHEFDIVVAPASQDPTAFEQFIAQCSNPAAPLIAFSNAFGSRADAEVCEPTTAALALAISTLEPLVARAAALPRLPFGVDRNGLLALALAYTRNCAIEAKWQPNSAEMIEYPLLLGIVNPRSVLEELADAGLLGRRFFERLHLCRQCGSSQLHAREVCLACHSSHLSEHSIVHHYACGFQAAQPAFEHRDGGYVCPKCHKQLRHYGVDYDKPGLLTACQTCGETMAEPEVGFVCAGCGSYTSGENAGCRDWYHYDLLADGVAALRACSLPHADVVDPESGYSLRDFRLIVANSLSVAHRYERPLTAYRVTIDTDELEQQIGRRGVLDVCRFVRELVVQNTRVSDVVAALPAGVVACLNETDRASSDIALHRLCKQIVGTVRPRVKLKIDVFEGEHINALLQDLN